MKSFAQKMILVLIGFFLMPNEGFAHSLKSTDNYCLECQKDGHCSNTDKSCCTEHHSNKNQNNGCEGNCNHSGCHCPTVNVVPLPNNNGINKHILLKETTQNHLLDFDGCAFANNFHPLR